MIFSKFKCYTHDEPLDFDDADLERVAFKPRDKTQPFAFGLIPVEGEDYVVTQGRYCFLRARFDEALLPTKVINAEVDERCAKLEYVPSRKEKSVIKEQVQHDLLPQAFTVTTIYWLMHDSKTQRFMVNQPATNCEAFLGLLRNAFGSLPVKPLDIDGRLEAVFTHTLLKPDSLRNSELTLGSDAVMERDGAKVTLKNHDLTVDEIGVHLNAGKLCTKLSFDIEDTTSFSVDSNFNFSQVKLGDIEDDGNDMLFIEAAVCTSIVDCLTGYCKNI